MIVLGRRIVWAGFFLVVSSASMAFADGKAFSMVAIPKTPDIPQQRAIIVWRGGVETLIVESTFKTDSPEIGWVLPLPANPTKLEQVDPGVLPAMSLCLRPSVTTSFRISPTRYLLLFLCGAIFAFLMLLPRLSWFQSLIITALAGILLLALVPSYRTLGSNKSAELAGLGGVVEGVETLSVQQVGNYDAAILRAKAPQALSEWLKTNGLKSLDERDAKIISDYIARQWVFVVAKIRRTTEGLLTPHPIQAAFNSAEPIYPMKLTALGGGGKTRMELTVVSDRQAGAKGFSVITADSYVPIPAGESSSYYKSYIAQPCYAAKNTHLIIGSPDMQPLLWPGCVVTKLSADLKPPQMDRDITFELGDLNPYRMRIYSEDARHQLLQAGTAGGGALAFVLFGILFHHRQPRRWEYLVLGAIIALAIVAPILVASTLHVEPVTSGFSMGPSTWPSVMSGFIQQLCLDGRLAGTMSDEKLFTFPKILGNELSPQFSRNPYTGAEMIRQRSPGDFWICRERDRTYLCLYDVDGREYRLNLGVSSSAKDKSK